MGGREYALWDPEGKLLAREEIDSQSGIVYPFYDADNGIVFLTGKVRSLFILKLNLVYITGKVKIIFIYVVKYCFH